MEKSIEVQKIEFLSLPDEVIDTYILPYLHWNDFLRLRRVCKKTKSITEDFLKAHPDLPPEIEINEDDKTFNNFLRMNIPTTRIFLNNVSGDEFYQQAGTEADEFLERFGSLIKYLRVDQISIYNYGKEWDFLDALINLQSFEARYYGCGKLDSPLTVLKLHTILEEKFALAQKDHRFNMNNIYDCIPKILKNLKRLKIGNNEQIQSPELLGYIVGFLTQGRNLEYISLPFPTDISQAKSYLPGHFLYPMSAAFVLILTSLKDQPMRQITAPLKNLKTIDFRSYPANFAGVSHDPELVIEWFSFQIFAEILESCVKGKKKLMNVPSHWFMRREEFPEIDSPETGSLVLSLVNLHPAVLSMHLENLERIEINQSSGSSPGADWRERRKEWPSLKSLDITIDGKISSSWFLNTEVEGEENILYPSVMTDQLLQFFFYDIKRPTVTEIRLNFVEEAGRVAVPKMDDIVSSCPNLKKLTVINWPGTNEELAKLWDGLPELEEVSLEYCENLRNVAFVGKDADSQAFLKLTKLKKLSLKGLDCMPNITDTLFSDVIRHLKLTQLTLTSDKPVKRVTQIGIKSLLDGCFADSIEKFSFKGWSLANVSMEEFRKMERKFRSYDML